jgi:CMP-2-keto-3-deoxyoctulosonic acid synthetase
VGTEISDELAAELQETEVEVAPADVRIRVNSKIEDMVFGRAVVPAEFDENGKLLKHAVDHGLQFYSFEEGTPYKVPVELAKHLDRIGYLYH